MLKKRENYKKCILALFSLFVISFSQVSTIIADEPVTNPEAIENVMNSEDEDVEPDSDEEDSETMIRYQKKEKKTR